MTLSICGSTLWGMSWVEIGSRLNSCLSTWYEMLFNVAADLSNWVVGWDEVPLELLIFNRCNLIDYIRHVYYSLRKVHSEALAYGGAGLNCL